MKKLKFLLCALFAVLCCTALTACGDDDDDEPANSIVGTWVDMDWASFGDSRVLTFYSNGTYTEQWVENSYSGTESGVYSLNGNVLIMTTTDDTYVYTIVINGNTATVTEDDGFTVTWVKQ